MGATDSLSVGNELSPSFHADFERFEEKAEPEIKTGNVSSSLDVLKSSTYNPVGDIEQSDESFSDNLDVLQMKNAELTKAGASTVETCTSEQETKNRRGELPSKNEHSFENSPITQETSQDSVKAGLSQDSVKAGLSQ